MRRERDARHRRRTTLARPRRELVRLGPLPATPLLSAPPARGRGELRLGSPARRAADAPRPPSPLRMRAHAPVPQWEPETRSLARKPRGEAVSQKHTQRCSVKVPGESPFRCSPRRRLSSGGQAQIEGNSSSSALRILDPDFDASSDSRSRASSDSRPSAARWPSDELACSGTLAQGLLDRPQELRRAR